MKKNATNLLITLNIVLIIILILLLVLNFIKPDKPIAYVNNDKLFENFIMTKELKRIGEKEFHNRKTALDSLYSKLQSVEFQNADRKLLMEQFIQQKQELNNFNDYFASEQSSEIWARIKSYSTEFSKENNYKIIIGSEEKGTILFAAESIDVTNDLLSYINEKYEGVK